MKRRRVYLIGLLVLLAAIAVATGAAAGDQDELAQVRAATAQFHDPQVAEGAGWGLVPGLDHCFENPGTGAMGYHYINTDWLDGAVEITRPESLVYAPGADGKLKLAAVEYIVPAGNGAPSPLFGQSFHLNEELGVYVLHVWIWRNNPAGIFEDWNPRVSCP